MALLMSIYPEVAEHIKRLTIMGESIGGGLAHTLRCRKEDGNNRVGNVTMWAEFDCYCDPESAQVIFSNQTLPSKTTLLPLNIIHMAFIPEEVLDLVLYGPHGEGKRVLVQETSIKADT
ncbi:hypothetical protein BO78DRAFT_420984 [Aspergillus sclerotiicarbonarius CBS 121057]|uniref:Inosine/uridine-preferring nucleoside hydrolase domain-containing protein n=1 Tax=Aspergillus sclerotiicarbonarius (strain CBS 121057 / IBT 28362) TaxID=1448318 RepID=A0A319E7H3_ASPSB|nr:hypothetical protein BO78DRAFT_420984 [Aspergillus sclerotiicarbonarius CBS 121057]